MHDSLTGFVTTTRITHATPAGLYAHVNHRDWECDTSIPKNQQSCIKDIARQLVEDQPGNQFKVIYLCICTSLHLRKDQYNFKFNSLLNTTANWISRAKCTHPQHGQQDRNYIFIPEPIELSGGTSIMSKNTNKWMKFFIWLNPFLEVILCNKNVLIFFYIEY